MDNLALLIHLRRRHFQLLEEWVKQAGIYYLLSLGYTHEQFPSILPMKVIDHLTFEEDLEFRKQDVTEMKRTIDQLEEYIQETFRKEESHGTD